MTKFFNNKKDNQTATVNSSVGWDADSVNFAIITRPTSAASGNYQVTYIVRDGLNNQTDYSASTSISTSSYSGSLPTPNVNYNDKWHHTCKKISNMNYKIRLTTRP